MTSALTIRKALPWLDPTRQTGESQRHAMRRYMRWLASSGAQPMPPDLRAYRDAMFEDGLTPSSVSAHLSTVRARYQAMLEDAQFRDYLYALPDVTALDSIADKRAAVEEIVDRIALAILPSAAPVSVVDEQDRPDSQQVRLTGEQASRWLQSIALMPVGPVKRARDLALIALMLASGIREGETVALRVDDLRQRLDGQLALWVRHGKGGKARVVPYGAMEDVLRPVDAWLALAGIEGGAVWRGLYPPDGAGYHRVRPSAMTRRALIDVVMAYPAMIDGELVTLRPHDLRRSYARMLFDAGVEPVRIQQNLGHSDLKTTLGYIGDLNARDRRPPQVFVVPM